MNINNKRLVDSEQRVETIEELLKKAQDIIDQRNDAIELYSPRENRPLTEDIAKVNVGVGTDKPPIVGSLTPNTIQEIIDEKERIKLGRGEMGCQKCFKTHRNCSNGLRYLPNSGIKHCIICDACMTWWSSQPIFNEGKQYWCCSMRCRIRFSNAVIL